MKDKQYANFEDWFDELENYNMRSERFFESLGQFKEGKLYQRNLIIWLEAAFQAGKESK
jgi:hypothetical protein